MANFKNIFILGISLVLLDYAYGRLKPEQFKTAMSMIGNACFAHYPDVTPEMAKKVRDGIFSDDDKENIRCFTNCVWEHLGSMHLGEFDAEHAMEQFEFLVPRPWQEGYRKGILDCKDKVVEAGGPAKPCEAGYALTKCFSAVPNFLFP